MFTEGPAKVESRSEVGEGGTGLTFREDSRTEGAKQITALGVWLYAVYS